MQKSPTYRYHVGSAGWEHAAWRGTFYPEDMPEEWHLTFYNNVFSCVYLPYSEWSSHDDAELSAWNADVTDRFRFVLEVNPQGLNAEDIRKLALFFPYLGLLVDASGTTVPDSGCEGRLLWLEAHTDLKALAQTLRGLEQNAGLVFLISHEHDLGVMDRVKTLLEVMGL